MSEHGLNYRSRDGRSGWDLLPFLAQHPTPSQLPRPERDVLASLLRYVLEGLEHLDAVERYGLIEPAALPVRGSQENERRADDA